MGLESKTSAHRRAQASDVLVLLDASGPLTRRDVAEALDLHPASANRVVASLIDRGVITRTAQVPSDGPGRPTDRLALAEDAGHAVGIEFGRGRLAVTVLDATGQVVLARDAEDAPPFRADLTTTDGIAEAVRNASIAAGLPSERLFAVGVALHDVVDADGRWTTQDRPHDPPFDVRNALEDRLGAGVHVDDVSRAFATAEHRFGAGAGESDTVYVFVGSHGVGGGLFVNGSMLVSSSGHCGEIGHVIIDENGARCQCGARGCLETVASPRAARRRLRELLHEGVASSLGPDAEFDELCRASERGDAAASTVLDEIGGAVAHALAPTVNLAGTPVAIVGGGLRNAGPAFLHRVASTLRTRVVPGLAPRVDVRFAALPPHAGAWGVAATARERALRDGALLDLPASVAVPAS